MKYQELKPNPVGLAFDRYCKSLLMAGGDFDHAAQLAAGWADSPGVRLTHEKSATTGLSTSDGLAEFGIADEVYELYREASLFGRLSARMQRVPFLARVPVEGSGAIGGWVSEHGTKPVAAMSFDRIELSPYKAAVLAVVSDELLKLKGGDRVIRRLLIGGLSRFIDSEFLGSAPAVPGESPGGIAAGQPVVLGLSPADPASSLETAAGLLDSWGDVVVIAHPQWVPRLAVAGLVQPGAAGLLVGGLPLVTSTSAPADRLLLLDVTAVYFADDRESNVAVGTHGNVLMDNGESPASELTVNLWQQNLTSIKLERRISWIAAHDGAAVVVEV